MFLTSASMHPTHASCCPQSWHPPFMHGCRSLSVCNGDCFADGVVSFSPVQVIGVANVVVFLLLFKLLLVVVVVVVKLLLLLVLLLPLLLLKFVLLLVPRVFLI